MKSMTPVPSRSKVVTFGVTAIVLIISTIGLLPAKTMSGTIVVDNAVTFYENDYIGDSVMEPQTAGSEVALTLFGSLLVKFSNPGYTFDYWTTNSNGSGTKYTDGELYNFALGNMDLYAQWKPNQVRFDENATLNDSVDCVESASTTTALTPFSDLNPTFSKPGYVFDGWSTSPSGAGVAYADGSTYDFTLGSMTLYAQWSAATYSVSYSAGGGTASATSASYTTGGNSITLPSASQSGYTFDGWFSAAQGGNLIGLGGASFTPTSSTTLFAQWSAATYSVTYSAGGGMASATSASYTTGGNSITLPNASQAGYTFDGWFTALQGGSLVGTEGNSFTPVSSMTLYAQWSAATYSIAYSAGGGTASATSASYTTGGNSITLPNASQAGYTFDGWFSAAQGGNLIGLGGASFTPTSSTTLFAQWTAIPSFDVTFSVNGGVGTVGPVSALSGATFSLPSPSTMSRPGYVFTGWNTVADGSGTAFGSSSTMVLSGPMTLYAQWRQLPAASVRFVLNGARGSVPAISAYNGAVETLPSPPALARPGYIFTGWNTRANGTGSMFASGVSMTLGASLTLYAQWSGHAPARLVSPIGPFATAHVGVAGSLVAQVDRLASLIIRQQRHIVTLYGYPSTAATAQAGIAEGRARVSSVAAALRRALTHAHHGGVRVVVVDEGPAAGSSNRVSVVVR